MNERSDQQLLSAYAQGRDDAAFAELVRRHVDAVHSTARRLLVDPHLAEDATQNAFVALARQAADVARRLERGATLSGWLHLTTRNLASNAVRTEVRRRAREREAIDMQNETSGNDAPPWESIAPHLDPALAELGDPDRDALLLRFFERKTAREIGERLGIGEEAAQKRVSRALDRLRGVLAARGVAVASGSLAGTLAANAVQVAPASLVASTTAAVVAMPVGSIGAASGISWIMKATQLKTCVTAALAIALAIVAVVEHRANRRLRAETEALRAAVDVAGAGESAPLPVAAAAGPSEELLRLRGEVARLRREQSDAAKLSAENRALRAEAMQRGTARAAGEADADQEEAKRRGIAKMVFAKDWVLACVLFASENGGEMPSGFDEARKHFPKHADASVPEPADGPTEADFEIVYRGKLDDLSNPPAAIVLREKEAFANFGGVGMARTYGFADGHTEIHRAADGNFEPWELQHVPKRKTAGQ